MSAPALERGRLLATAKDYLLQIPQESQRVVMSAVRNPKTGETTTPATYRNISITHKENGTTEVQVRVTGGIDGGLLWKHTLQHRPLPEWIPQKIKKPIEVFRKAAFVADVRSVRGGVSLAAAAREGWRQGKYW